MIFGDFVRQRRIDMGYTLREFCRLKDQDTAYISRLENNLISPPKSQDKLKPLAMAFEINEKSDDWTLFFDLAAASNKQLPDSLTEDNPNVINFLPAFCRTARKKEVNEQDIKKLLELIKGEVPDDAESQEYNGRLHP